MKKPTLLVLAAGIGSRYGGLKQIDPVGPNGEIVLDYSVYDALQTDFGKVVFVIRKEIDAAFREAVGDKLKQQIKVEYVYQELGALPEGEEVPDGRAKPWGTGHAVMVAAEVIDEPFVVINADDFYGRRSFAVVHDFLTDQSSNAQADYAVVGFVLRNTLSEHGSVARGVCRYDEQGYLRSITETTNIRKAGEGAVYESSDGIRVPLSGDECVSMNMWGFDPSIFDHLKKKFSLFLRENKTDPKAEFFLPSAVDELITTGQARVRVLATPEKWYGVTYTGDRGAVQKGIREQVAAGTYPVKLWE